jgi:hypothetical protein
VEGRYRIRKVQKKGGGSEIQNMGGGREIQYKGGRKD